MSDRACCIYCGRSLDDPGWTDSREIAQGYHQYCHAGTSQGRHRAEYAALAAAHDAASAEAERLIGSAERTARGAVLLGRGRILREDREMFERQGTRLRLREVELERDVAAARADAAEARIAEQDRLIHDGIYALMGERHAALTRAAAVWEERALAAEAQIAAAREDGARSMAEWSDEPDHDYSFCRRGKGGWLPIPGEQALAAWQAHETEEGRGGD